MSSSEDPPALPAYSLPPPEGVEEIQVGDHDVLSGRGAVVNEHKGNKHFRSLCVMRKAEFDAGNHVAKRRIATSIVDMVQSLDPPGRFLKRSWDVSAKKAAQAGMTSSTRQGPWIEIDHEKAVQKAMQVMRDHERADRLETDSDQATNGKKKRKSASIQKDEWNEQMKRQQMEAQTATVSASISDNEGCDNGIVPTDSDVLNGRGGFINEHAGNKYFRALAAANKDKFDAGNQQEKKDIAAGMVRLVHAQDPPGRFLRRIVEATPQKERPRGLQGPWEVATDDEATNKAIQVLRDLWREKKSPKPKPASARASKSAEV